MREIALFSSLRSHARERAWKLLATALAFVCAGLGLLLLGLLAGGCTIAPAPVVAHQASWDGTNQNSGVLGLVTPDGRALLGPAADEYAKQHGQIAALIITETAAERYNGLVLQYGARFSPPLLKDDGLSGPVGADQGKPTWRISNAAVAHWVTMTRWKKDGS